MGGVEGGGEEGEGVGGVFEVVGEGCAGGGGVGDGEVGDWTGGFGASDCWGCEAVVLKEGGGV